jgi:hypothetical protein
MTFNLRTNDVRSLATSDWTMKALITCGYRFDVNFLPTCYQFCLFSILF